MFRLQDHKLYLPELIRHFLAAFIPFSVALAAFLYLYSWLESTNSLATLSKSEAVRIEATKNATQTLLKDAVTDINLLASEPVVLNWLETPAPTATNELKTQLILLSRSKHLYDQIRILGLNGKEELRVNFAAGQPYAVPPSELQDKSSRYYFLESNHLSRGTVFLSPLDLNVDNGTVVRPLKPTIRLATPLFDRQGVRRGVLVINYLAQSILDKIRETSVGIQGDLMVVNGDGFWLLAPRPEDEWGFQLDPTKAFALKFPEAWMRMHAGERQIQTKDGLFSAALLRPATISDDQKDMLAISTGDIPPEQYAWWLISHIPSHKLAFLLKNEFELHYAFVFTLVLIGVLSFSYAAMRVARLRSDENLKKAAKVMEVTHDGVLILDLRRQIISANQAASNITGYLSSELTGQFERALRAHLEEDEREEAVWRQVEDQGMWQGEIWNRRKSGEAYLALATISRITDHKGRLQNYIKIFADITDRKMEEQALRKLAHHDPLTGLPNRALLLDRLEVALAAAKRSGRKVAVLFLDLDKFKPVNDELGHEAGDKLLCEIARRLQSVLRDADTVARMGGDEFVVLLPEIEHDHDVLTVAQTLVERIGETIQVKGQSRQVGCSVGISFYPADGDEPARLVEQADQAMYRAKQAGSGAIRMAGRELPEHPIPARRHLKSVT